MNKATVTFKSDVRTINIEFVHNVETETLDYNVTIDPQLNDGDQMDLATILADRFLGSLTVSDDEVVVEPDTDESDNNI
jgi:hypothetical protein